MLLLSLILGAATSFGGGTVDELAQSLADSTEKNVVIVTSKDEKVPKFTYEPGGTEVLAQTIKKGAGLTMAPGGDTVFSDHAFVGQHFQAIAPSLPAAPNTANKLPDEAVKAGRVTLHTKGASPISVQGIAEAKWSKPVAVDFLMRDLAVSASVTDMPEKAFLGAVAKAAGGFLTTNDKGFLIMYDAEQLRGRVIDTLKQATTPPVKQEVDIKREFYGAVVGVLPQDALMSIFEVPGDMPRLDVIPGSDLATLSIAYIKALLEVQQTQASADPAGAPPRRRFRPGGSGAASGGAIPNDILNRVDNRATVHLRLNAEGVIVLSVPVIEGRTSQYIDL